MANSSTISNNGLLVYVDENTFPAYQRKTVSGWYQASVNRKGVASGFRQESAEFEEWKTRCYGQVIIQPEELETGSFKIPNWHVYFEKEEDLVNYLLTFEELPKQLEVDAAAFYAPYVPLTTTSVINYSNITPVSFNTRYGLIDVISDSTGNSDSSI